VLAEYQAFGTNRRFDAADGNVDAMLRGDARLGGGTVFGISSEIYRRMREEPQFRIALVEATHPTDMRFYGLTTPQGFDPFLPAQYRDAVEPLVTFTTNRLFDLDPGNEQALRFFGVRWVVTRDGSDTQKRLDGDERYVRLEPGPSFYITYEYRNATPAYRFGGEARVVRWGAHHRHFDVASPGGGRFVLVEQFYPGWRARIDGADAPVRRAEGTFQGVEIPRGNHRLTIDYEPRSVLLGAAITLVSLTVLVAAVRRTRPAYCE
jgi:hypothetical protein